MKDVADMVLVRRFANEHCEQAFAELVSRHLNLVYSVAWRKTGKAEAAEEITQTVFILLAKKAERLGEKTVVSAWLYQTARLTAANFVRAEFRRARREQEAYMQSLFHTTEPELWRQIAPLLEDAIGGLGEKDRSAVVLRFIEQKSFQEVGAALGASENAAKKRVAHALEKLRRFFSKRGVVSTAAVIAIAISANSVQAAPPLLGDSVAALALAKGAGVTGSKLALLKGTLKWMAWAKMKLAVLLGAGVMMAAAGGTSYYFAQASLGGTGGAASYPREAWANCGFATPEDTVKTMVWSKSVGNLNVFNESAIPELSRQIMAEVLKGRVTEQQKSAWGIEAFKNITGLYFEKRTVLPDGEITLRIHIDHFPKNDYSINTFTNTGGDWKLAYSEEHYGGILYRFPAVTDAECTARGTASFSGVWTGLIKLGAGGLHELVKIAEPYPKVYRADLYGLDQGAQRMAAEITVSGDTLTLVPLSSGHGTFKGKLSADGKEMVGQWLQGGRQIPMAFTRAK